MISPGLGAPQDRPRWLLVAAPAALVVAWAAVVIFGGWSGAFAALAGFVDPGALARWGVPLITVVVQLALAVTIAALWFAVTVLTPGPGLTRALRVASGAAAVWAVAGLLQVILRYSVIAGVPVTDLSFGEQLWLFVSDIPLGRSYLVVVLIAALVSLIAMAVRGPTGAAWTLALAGVAIGAQANTGHTAGAASHELAISAMFMHLVGAGLWVGGVAMLWLAAVHSRQWSPLRWPLVVSRFSVLAAWCFVMVAISGVVNASIRLGGWGDLSTPYGLIVMVKVFLMAVLGVIGVAHRRWVISALNKTDAPRAVRGVLWRLVAVELVVMGAVSGVAVALAGTAPPVPDVPFINPTAAEIVTGHPLPPELTGVQWVAQWRWDVVFAMAAVAGGVTYLRWVIRLRRRGDRWPVGRAISWCLGMVVVLWTTSGGPAMYGHILFSAHMVQHMVLAMIVPIFIVLGAPVTLLLRAVPVRHDGSRGPREWILAVVQSRWGQFFAHPIVAAINFSVSMVVFYYTPFFEWSLTTYVGHAAMIIHFCLAGYMFVNALIGIDPGPHRLGFPQRLVMLFATMAFHAFFGVALTSGTALLVPQWFGLLGRPWGPSAIADQQLGGGVAWGVGELPTLALAILVAVMWTKSDEREARRRDRRADRDGDAELAEYNAMLSALAARDHRDREAGHRGA